jgi:hypothetical protein
MKTSVIAPLAFVCLLAPVAPARAQSTISPTAKYAYSANAGWLNLRHDQPTAPNGVTVTESYLSGYAYSANVGWIHLGDGSPANGHTYANNNQTDYGVNVNAAGHLTGQAYGANIGWITFEQTQGQPRLNFLTGQLTGSAYGANIGWIALDTTQSDLISLTVLCPDTDADGIGDAYEQRYFGLLSTANGTSDRDGDGQTDRAEFEAGTSPIDSTDWFGLVSYTIPAAGGSHSFTFRSVPNRLYRLEHTPNLAAPWSPCLTKTQGTEVRPAEEAAH